MATEMKGHMPEQASFVLGEYIVPTRKPLTPQERKSPPLSALTPNRDQYLKVSPERHFSREHMQREWEKLWTKAWVCAGRVSDLAGAGAWFRFDLGRESFVIVRGADNEITALYNVCQHRGNRIVDEDFGKARGGFVCSYHSWRYDLKGKNVRVTDADQFKPAALCGNISMKKVRCEIWGGFVFINMNDNAGSLLDHLGEITDVMASYHMDRMHVGRDVIVELACNWKVLLDAFSENYHVHATHSAVMPLSEDLRVQIDFYKGGHTRRITPIGDPSSRFGAVPKVDVSQELYLAESGVDPRLFKGSAREVRAAVADARRKPDNLLGIDYAGFSDGQITDDWAMNIFPNMHWSTHPEAVLFMRYYPHESDPNRCRLHITVLVAPLKVGARPPAYMGVPPDQDISGKSRPARIYANASDANIKDVVGQLIWEDLRNTREAQRGLQSRGFEAIRLSEEEQCIMHQYAEIDRYLSEP
jgi:phenylpropionate dioxygenase-like ring-hydroxylating dioxygenase large terminal subunit